MKRPHNKVIHTRVIVEEPDHSPASIEKARRAEAAEARRPPLTTIPQFIRGMKLT